MIGLLTKEMQAMRTPEEAREFMLRHGEGIVDMVGAVIDDIERDFKVGSGTLLPVDGSDYGQFVV